MNATATYLPWVYINFETGRMLRFVGGRITNVAQLSGNIRGVTLLQVARFRLYPHVASREAALGAAVNAPQSA